MPGFSSPTRDRHRSPRSSPHRSRGGLVQQRLLQYERLQSSEGDTALPWSSSSSITRGPPSSPPAARSSPEDLSLTEHDYLQRQLAANTPERFAHASKDDTRRELRMKFQAAGDIRDQWRPVLRGADIKAENTATAYSQTLEREKLLQKVLTGKEEIRQSILEKDDLVVREQQMRYVLEKVDADARGWEDLARDLQADYDALVEKLGSMGVTFERQR